MLVYCLPFWGDGTQLYLQNVVYFAIISCIIININYSIIKNTTLKVVTCWVWNHPGCTSMLCVPQSRIIPICENKLKHTLPAVTPSPYEAVRNLTASIHNACRSSDTLWMEILNVIQPHGQKYQQVTWLQLNIESLKPSVLLKCSNSGDILTCHISKNKCK